MKVYISVDMEGISGVATGPQTSRSDSDYAYAREWMMEDTNAAIEGALAAGADDILVNDSHETMRNLLYHRLHPAARLVSGSPKPMSMMAGIDASFDAAMFIGYHARGGGYGVLAHTWNGSVTAVRLNGVPVGEWGLNATLAGHFGVPIAVVAGDDCLAAEVQQELGPVETVVVKRALSRSAAEMLPRAQATQAIRVGAQRGLQRVGQVQPYQPGRPIQLQVDLVSPQMADSAAMLPGARRPAPLTIEFPAGDGLECFQAFYAIMALARYGM